jgi:hypothetical protein
MGFKESAIKYGSVAGAGILAGVLIMDRGGSTPPPPPTIQQQFSADLYGATRDAMSTGVFHVGNLSLRMVSEQEFPFGQASPPINKELLNEAFDEGSAAAGYGLDGAETPVQQLAGEACSTAIGNVAAKQLLLDQAKQHPGDPVDNAQLAFTDGAGQPNVNSASALAYFTQAYRSCDAADLNALNGGATLAVVTGMHPAAKH